MQWFLERISSPSLPVYFGIKDKVEHPEDFSVLVEKKVLKKSSNLEEVACQLCDENHSCQVRNVDGKLFYVCENGCGTKELTDDELAVFEYDNEAFINQVVKDLGIKPNNKTFEDVLESDNGHLFCLGSYGDKAKKSVVYYLRHFNPTVISLYFQSQGNEPKILLTNFSPIELDPSANAVSCAITEILSGKSGKQLLEQNLFANNLEQKRRVRFDEKNGNLFLDEKKIYTAGLNSPEFHFLTCLWQRWMEQVSYEDIYNYVKNALKRDVSDTHQKFSHKMKNSIKKNCPAIETVISKPTTGYYMMADPT